MAFFTGKNGFEILCVYTVEVLFFLCLVLPLCAVSAGRFFFLSYGANICRKRVSIVFPLCLVSTALAHLSDPKLSKDEVLRQLRVEMQRCLASLKGKRLKISQLQEDLQHCQARADELQSQLDDSQLSSSVRTAPYVTALWAYYSDLTSLSNLDSSSPIQNNICKLCR